MPQLGVGSEAGGWGPRIIFLVFWSFALLLPAAHADDFVLYGHGQGGDGNGYGHQGGHVSQRTKAWSAKSQADTEPWGRYDNSAPGYRSHGKWMSRPFYGHTPLDRIEEPIGAPKPSRAPVYRRVRASQPPPIRFPLWMLR